MLKLMLVVSALTLGCAPVLTAQAPVQAPSVLLLSDIHFDPFHDPGKVALLRSSPVSRWHEILAAPPSAMQESSFDDLQMACKAKGVDTPYPLLQATLAAAQERLPHPLFITVSGDLMAHKFDCLYQKFAPASVKDTYAEDYSAFAAKAVAFVAMELRRAFPGTPVYIALGNNDSGCKDYSEDEDSAFLRADAKAFAADVVSPANRAAYLNEFPALGDANLQLPAPFPHTRLLVLQDIFGSKRYATCGGKEDSNAAASQIAWLRTQLQQARAAHEHVWVLAHIPPGIDAYSTLTKGGNVCTGAAPVSFLSHDELAKALTDYADTVRLVLMGHTHMDEIKLLSSATGSSVPIKLVPSVSPVNGNDPAFTIAQVDPKRELLTDYEVYASNNEVESGWNHTPHWAEEYRYSSTYHEPDYSSAALEQLTGALVADKTGTTPAARAYEQFYFVGDPHISGNAKAAMMQLVWPKYACSMISADATQYRTCVCGAQ